MYLSKLSFLIEEIKTFHDKQKIKEFMKTTKALPSLLKEILHAKEEDKSNLNIQEGINLTRHEI
jgi:hypothetical protein